MAEDKQAGFRPDPTRYEPSAPQQPAESRPDPPAYQPSSEPQVGFRPALSQLYQTASPHAMGYSPQYYGATEPRYPQGIATPINAAVTQQPTQRVTTISLQSTTDHAKTAFIFAMVFTVFVSFLGCWWSLVCSVGAMIFALAGKASAASGDLGSAQMHTVLSIVCSILSALSVIVGLFFIALITVASIALQEADDDYDCYDCY